jgi:hypothetical protein
MWEFYKAQIAEILNEAFSSYQKDEYLYKIQLTAYAHVIKGVG